MNDNSNSKETQDKPQEQINLESIEIDSIISGLAESQIEPEVFNNSNVPQVPDYLQNKADDLAQSIRLDSNYEDIFNNQNTNEGNQDTSQRKTSILVDELKSDQNLLKKSLQVLEEEFIKPEDWEINKISFNILD